MMPENNFEQFENRYRITGKMQMETPLRIGKQIAPYSISSAPVLLQYDAQQDKYLPFIPGSSLKGVLRSACERIVTTFGIGASWTDPIFGSKEMGAKVRVRDAVTDQNRVDERIHCATDARPVPEIQNWDKCKHHCNSSKHCPVSDLKEKFYKPLIKNQGKNPVPKTYPLINEENIPSTVSFTFKIEVDNAESRDIGLILLGLDEFNNRRVHIGGGVSRGYGFASVESIEVSCLSSFDFSFRFEEDPCDADELKREAIEFLMVDGGYEGNENMGDNFNVYCRPKKELDGGCIVCEFGVECVTEFRMKGVDEETVTVDGMPVIPGSTIKGALRHKCYYDPEIEGRGKKVWIKGCKEPVIRWNVDKVDRIFGSTNNRSQLLVSDAFSDTITNVPDDKQINEIEKGSVLKCWIVFDNMEKEDIKTILDVLNDEIQITGNTSAKRNPKGEPERNLIRFALAKAWKFCIDDFKYDVTSQLEAA